MQEIGRKKKIRIFAGPNGSGKSTLIGEFSKKYNTGHFINADIIEKILENQGFLDLSDYNVKSTQQDWDIFLKTDDSLSLLEKSVKSGHKIEIEIKENFIVDKSSGKHSYEGSLVSMFLREKLFDNNLSFCFETVMSHSSKLEVIQKAKLLGYKTYLYFICIDDPEVNISRVENRVKKGGHDVDDQRVRDRYPKTLENLFPAILISDETYLFDNSGERLTMIAHIKDDSLILDVDENKFPNWFKKYVLINYN